MRATRSSRAGRAALLAVAGSLLALVAGLGTAGGGATQDMRPNVVVILTDDQTVESMRVMANVQRLLAREGVRFERSFASYPLCCPSRATLLTGQYAHNHGVLGNVPPRGGHAQLDHRSTLPVWLRRAGYHTAFVGKYLNGYGDRSRREIPPGWSDWRATLRSPGTRHLRYDGFMLNENGGLVRYPRGRVHYQTDVLTNHAVDAIQLGSSTGVPFFLLLSYFAPHGGGPRDRDDLRAPGVMFNARPAIRHRDAFAGEPFLPPPSFDEADVSDKPSLVRSRPRLSELQIQAMQESYEQRLEALLAVDEGVAQLVEALTAAGELENTLMVFTSDNGYVLGEHRIPPDRGKGSVYEPSVRVPLVMRGPGLVAGRRLTGLVSNVDLAATILDVARARPGRKLDGVSLLDAASGLAALPRRDLLLESSTYSAVRTERHVYVEHRSGDRELYDLARDPHQLRSRHAAPAFARLRAQLERRLDRLRDCAGAGCRRTRPVP